MTKNLANLEPEEIEDAKLNWNNATRTEKNYDKVQEQIEHE